MILAKGKIANAKRIFLDLKILYPGLLREIELVFLVRKYSSNNPKYWKLREEEFMLCLNILRKFYLRLIS